MQCIERLAEGSVDCGPGWQQGQLVLCNLGQKEGPWGGMGELRTKVLVQVGKDLVFLKLLCVRHIPEGGPARKLCTPV